jgi:homoserine dehydrogenase
MKVGILGYGTIGSGILSLVQGLPASLGVEAVKVFDLPHKKEVLGELYTGNADDICLSADIDVVFEAMGGDAFAHECIVKALGSGKSVITSNKEVVSKHFEEFFDLARANGVYFLCEASVGGGIPCIRTLQHQVTFDTVTNVYGILNGTTNFILTRMGEGQAFDEALKTAQKLGFAEADATADIEGLDVLRKISILSNIAYGTRLSYDQVKHYGIAGVNQAILADVERRGKVLKMVAQSTLVGDVLKVSVEPVLLDKTHLLAAASDEYNMVVYDCKGNGTLSLYGKGAGRYPTASAMIADLMDVVQGNLAFTPKAAIYPTVANFDQDSDYYVVSGGEARICHGLPADGNYTFYARIF